MVCLLCYYFNLQTNFANKITEHYELKIDWGKTRCLDTFSRNFNLFILYICISHVNDEVAISSSCSRTAEASTISTHSCREPSETGMTCPRKSLRPRPSTDLCQAGPIQGGGGGGGGGGWGGTEEGSIYLSLHCRHQNDSCIKMGSDKSHFNVSLIMRDKVTRRQCPQATTFEKKGEPKH